MRRDDAPHTILMSFVVVPDGRRTLDEKAIPPLMESITALGLRTPITVRENEAGDYILIAGHHRYEACKRLGHEHISAHCVEWDDREARLWEISENLHRAELSPVERAEQIDEWRRLTLEKGRHDAAPLGGAQPHEKGFKKTAETLGVDERTVRRAEKIAALPQETRDKAREEKWSQSRLLAVAKPTVEIPAPKEWEDVEAGQKRKFATLWNSLSPNVKAWARDNYIDAPVMDARFG